MVAGNLEFICNKTLIASQALVELFKEIAQGATEIYNINQNEQFY